MGREIDVLELWMIHHTLKAEVIREMITSMCVVWFGSVCVWDLGLCEGLGGGCREGMFVKSKIVESKIHVFF